MKKLNAVNWPYFVQDGEGRFNEPLNCLDCLRVFLKRRQIETCEATDSLLYIPSMRMEIDLASMEAKIDGMINKRLKLVRSESGVRSRGSSSRKNDGQMLNLFPRDLN